MYNQSKRDLIGRYLNDTKQNGKVLLPWYMGLPFYTVLSISDEGHFVRMECYCILYSTAQKSFINTSIIKIFFRTQKDFEMMTKMKMKLNPQNSVS